MGEFVFLVDLNGVRMQIKEPCFNQKLKFRYVKVNGKWSPFLSKVVCPVWHQKGWFKNLSLLELFYDNFRGEALGTVGGTSQ